LPGLLFARRALEAAVFLAAEGLDRLAPRLADFAVVVRFVAAGADFVAADFVVGDFVVVVRFVAAGADFVVGDFVVVGRLAAAGFVAVGRLVAAAAFGVVGRFVAAGLAEVARLAADPVEVRFAGADVPAVGLAAVGLAALALAVGLSAGLLMSGRAQAIPNREKASNAVRWMSA